MLGRWILGALVCLGLIAPASSPAQGARPAATSLEFIHAEGQFAIPVPLSPAVRAGNLIFVSGIPAYDKNGKLAVNDFPTQMKQVMESITGILKAAGVGWNRVVKVNVYITRREDFKEMNRIYASYFPDGKFPARTTAITPLPNPDFMLEIDCVAVRE
ncbi:RidA family protein [Ralstonia sp. A12]|uniref:RidA family protein n=1 Tax=Ralstonia sp. A12 TaxID=1217052 RepID=UPI0006947574|nr:RidA family protein [Ralstonia sp. A12]